MRIQRSLAAAALLAVLAVPARAGWEEGVAAFKSGNYAKAVTEFQGVTAANPNWPGGYLMLGQSQLKLGRSDAAVTALKKAHELNPNDATTQLALSRAYIETKRFTEANDVLRRMNLAALSKEQQSAHGQLLAAALTGSGRGSEALAPLKQAATASPYDATAQYNYGVAALVAGDTAAAVGALERATRLDSADVGKQKAYVQALIRAGREANQEAAKKASYAKAVEAARALVARANHHDNVMLLGEAQLGAGDYAAATATFEKAAGLDARDWYASFYIGQAQTAAGNLAAAEKALVQALAKAPAASDQLRIHRQLGFVYEKQKNWEAARKAYQKAGDGASVQRIEENQRIATENASIEERNRQVEELEKARRELEKELQQIPGQPKPPPKP